MPGGSSIIVGVCHVCQGWRVEGVTSGLPERTIHTVRSMVALWTGARRVTARAQCAQREPPFADERCVRFQIIRHGRIVTTLARAKAVRKRVDHMITLSKDGSLHARRQVKHGTRMWRQYPQFSSTGVVPVT